MHQSNIFKSTMKEIGWANDMVAKPTCRNWHRSGVHSQFLKHCHIYNYDICSSFHENRNCISSLIHSSWWKELIDLRNYKPCFATDEVQLLCIVSCMASMMANGVLIHKGDKYSLCTRTHHNTKQIVSFLWIII